MTNATQTMLGEQNRVGLGKNFSEMESCIYNRIQRENRSAKAMQTVQAIQPKSTHVKDHSLVGKVTPIYSKASHVSRMLINTELTEEGCTPL
jgi:mRNA-degrading endonuclease YafQ of YafQ-DinJ toxin-antitoxin module